MIIIKIDTSNAAFQNGNSGAEIARILRELADKVDGQDVVFELIPIYDSNGNRVGSLGTGTGTK